MSVWTIGLVMAVGLAAIPGTAVTQPLGEETAPGEMSRVRSRHIQIRQVIARASAESETFRRIVQTINAGDVIVYVEPGACRHGVRACLVKVTSAGGYRFVFVKVDTARAEAKLMAAIGHELHHAIEILSDSAVTDQASMLFFRLKKGERVRTSNTFETAAAIAAGDAVADEIRRFQQGGDRWSSKTFHGARY